MQFIYDKSASKDFLQIKDENYRYLFKVKRLKAGDFVNFVNFKDDILYKYTIKRVNKKESLLELTDSTNSKQDNKNFHIIWCIIDPKIIYQTLPMLNQIGVSKISFVYCDRSQKNFKIQLGKVKKILINSCQQSGRSDLMEIEIVNTLSEIVQKYKDFTILDFGGKKNYNQIQAVLIGCEGGFSEKERKQLQNNYKIGLKTNSILKSETATLAIASKALL